MSITVTYIIEFNGQKLTRIATAEWENPDKAVSEEFIQSLWKMARESAPIEKKTP